MLDINKLENKAIETNFFSEFDFIVSKANEADFQIRLLER